MEKEQLASIDDAELLKNYDETQVKLMHERCLLVNQQDEVIGFGEKKECHINENIEKGMLHRAFSIFLFNSKGELLLQKRASDKITFPDYWTNTVCSHPLQFTSSSGTPLENQPEMEEENQLGVKRAAKRKLEHELGIVIDSEHKFEFLTRILYKSPSCKIWGEHEIDYVLVLQANVEVNPNPNEVSDYRYFQKEELKEFIETAEEKGLKLTPWFQLITDSLLFKWWGDLRNLQSHKDTKIHDLIDKK